MEENNKKKFSGAQVAFMIFVAIVITAAAAIAVFVFITKTNTTEKTPTVDNKKETVIATNTIANKIVQNTTTENIIKAGNTQNTSVETTTTSKGFETKQVVISNIVDNGDNLRITVYELSKDATIVDDNQIENLKNGGTIHFRGRDWKFVSQDTGLSKLIHLKDANDPNSTKEAGILGNTFYTLSGGKRAISDYKSETPITYTMKKNALRAFEPGTLKYDEATNSIVPDSHPDATVNSNWSAEVINEESMFFNNANGYGDSIIYIIGGVVEGVQVTNGLARD